MNCIGTCVQVLSQDSIRKMALRVGRATWLFPYMAVAMLLPNVVAAKSRRPGLYTTAEAVPANVKKHESLRSKASFVDPSCRVLDPSGKPIARMSRESRVQLVAEGLIPGLPVELFVRGRFVRGIGLVMTSDSGEARIDLRGDQVPIRGNQEDPISLIFSMDADASSAFCRVQFYERYPKSAIAPVLGPLGLLLTGMGLWVLGRGCARDRRNPTFQCLSQ